MLLRDMLDNTANEIKHRDSLFNIYIVFMAVVVEGDILAIVFINTRGSNDRPSQISANVLDDFTRVALLWFSIDIETVLMISVGSSLVLSEGIAYLLMHQGKQSSLPGITEIFIVEMRLASPPAGITEAALGDKTVNVRIPFEIPAESVEDTDETRSEAFSLVIFEEHPGDDRVNGRKEVIKE